MEKKTPLYDLHLKLGGKIVPFAGYLLPVQYPSGVIAEHNAVRNACGLFDVSHMGEILFEGPDALNALQNLLGFNEGHDGWMRIAAILQVVELTLFRSGRLFTLMLLLVQSTAQTDHLTIKTHGVFVRKESFGLLTGILHFLIGNECAVHTLRHAATGRQEEHIPVPQQLLGTALTQNRT